jgi:hypothetical protein
MIWYDQIVIGFWFASMGSFESRPSVTAEKRETPLKASRGVNRLRLAGHHIPLFDPSLPLGWDVVLPCLAGGCRDSLLPVEICS